MTRMNESAAETARDSRESPQAATDLPRITLVTPTFNRPEFLEAAILSVLEQDYPNLEYIIVDGGSTDPRVFELIRKYEDRLAWWMSEPDKGHAHAVRKGFERATGDLMNWICSDDTLMPGALRAVGECFRAHPEADVVYGHANLIDEGGRAIKNCRAVNYSFLEFLVCSNLHWGSVFWTRELYHRVGGQLGGADLKYAQHNPELELFFRFLKANARWVFLPRTLSTFRLHGEQHTIRDDSYLRGRASELLRQRFPVWSHPAVWPWLWVGARLKRYASLIAQGDTKYLLARFTKKIYED